MSRRIGARPARARLRPLVALPVVVLLSVLAAVPAAYAGDGDGTTYGNGHVEGDQAVIDGTQQTGDPAGGDGNQATPVDDGGVITPQPWKEHRYIPACSQNRPDGGADVMCPMAAFSCPKDGDIRYGDWWRWVQPDGSTGAWEYAGTVCRGIDEPTTTKPKVTPQSVVAQARAAAPESEVHVQPDGRTYVNVPTNFYADQTSVTVTVSIFGNAIPVRFAPATYQWDFGDGGTAVGAGVANAAVGQDGAVEHAYQRGGSFGVTLTRTFTITFTLPDGSTHTVPGKVTSTSAPYPLQVGEIQSVVQDAS